MPALRRRDQDKHVQCIKTAVVDIRRQIPFFPVSLIRVLHNFRRVLGAGHSSEDAGQNGGNLGIVEENPHTSSLESNNPSHSDNEEEGKLSQNQEAGEDVLFGSNSTVEETFPPNVVAAHEASGLPNFDGHTAIHPDEVQLRDEGGDNNDTEHGAMRPLKGWPNRTGYYGSRVSESDIEDSADQIPPGCTTPSGSSSKVLIRKAQKSVHWVDGADASDNETVVFQKPAKIPTRRKPKKVITRKRNRADEY